MMPSPVLLATVPRCGDGLGQETVVCPPDALGRVLTERGALGDRVDQVGEEDRRGAGGPCGRLAGRR